MAEQNFDVFLAHSSVDKPLIRELYGQLKARGLKPWLDEEEISPGTSFQEGLQRSIGQVKAAAICIGASGELGRWQAMELRTFISQCVERNIPIIPVLLPGIETIPEGLLFLKEFHAVSFQELIEEELALSRLEWGITGHRPPIVQGNGKTAQSLKEVAKQPQVVIKPPLNARYVDLERYLKNGQWKEADDETYRLMIREVGKEEEKYLGGDNLKKISCKSLNTIDGLWVQHSAGRFGFSVQKRIYLDSCGGFLSDNISLHSQIDHLQKFIKMNGWDDGLRYDIASPIGHLPGVRQFGYPWQMRSCGGVVYCLFVRLQACNL